MQLKMVLQTYFASFATLLCLSLTHYKHSQEHSMQKATLFYLLLLSLTLYKPVYYVFNISSVQKNFSLTFYSYGFNKIHPHHPVHVNSHFW